MNKTDIDKIQKQIEDKYDVTLQLASYLDRNAFEISSIVVPKVEVIVSEEMIAFQVLLEDHLTVINTRAKVYLNKIKRYKVDIPQDGIDTLKDLETLNAEELFNLWKHELAW